MKTTKKRVKLDRLENKKVTDQEQQKIKGGKGPMIDVTTPAPPSGPVPIPYPNRKKIG